MPLKSTLAGQTLDDKHPLQLLLPLNDNETESGFASTHAVVFKSLTVLQEGRLVIILDKFTLYNVPLLKQFCLKTFHLTVLNIFSVISSGDEISQSKRVS